MYSEKAIERINKIDWRVNGTKGTRNDSKLMAEFLRRMAIFFVSNNLTPQNPLLIDIANEFGYQKSVDYAEIYSKETLKYLDNNMYVKYLINSYIKLSLMSDVNEEVNKYLYIYEPVIRLLEKGIDFIVRSGFIDVTNVGSFPISNWVSRSQDEPFDINNI